VDGRTDMAGFCHSIHIITGVSLFYVGGGLITIVSPVTIYLRLRLLVYYAASSLPYRGHIFRSPPSVFFFASTRIPRLRLLVYYAASSLPYRGNIFRSPPSVFFFASTRITHLQLLAGSPRPGSLRAQELGE
jgi:hypothetical protein